MECRLGGGRRVSLQGAKALVGLVRRLFCSQKPDASFQHNMLEIGKWNGGMASGGAGGGWKKPSSGEDKKDDRWIYTVSSKGKRKTVKKKQGEVMSIESLVHDGRKAIEATDQDGNLHLLRVLPRREKEGTGVPHLHRALGCSARKSPRC